MARWLKIGILVFALNCVVGCDLGTYEQRLEQRIDDMRENELPDFK